MADASGGRLIFSRTPDSNIGGPNSKAKSKNTIYRGTFNGRPVAVREVHFDSPNSSPTGHQSNKQRFIKECQVLLTLRHDNIVRCLDYRLSNDKPNSEGFVILELCQGTLEDFLVGRLGNDDVKPPELVWQIIAGLDYLHQNNITHGNLNPRKIMVMKKSDLTFKITGFGLLKATNKKPGPTPKPPDDIFALGEICQSVLKFANDQEMASILANLVQLLKQPKPEDRPDSTLILCHPFFILYNEEARNRLMEYMMYDKDILVHFNTQELEKWYRSLDENMKKDMKREDYAVLEDLIERFSVDLKVMSLMTKGRRDVPRLLSHFIWHSMVVISQKPRITLDEVVGKGLYGTVYRGGWKDKKRNIRAAFKKANFAEGSMKEDRLEHEMDLLRLMDSVFVVKFYGNVKKNGVKLSAMELCEGNLHQYVNDKLFNLPAVDDKVILGQISCGLAHIHQKGIVHRDLNPYNILLWRSTTSTMLLIKVGGFSCSQKAGDVLSTADFTGTSSWVAPEVIRADEGHERASFESDMWSLGILFYFVLTKGQHPFEVRGVDNNVREVLIKSLKSVPKMEAMGEQWEAADLILRLTDQRPKRRPNICLVLHHPYFSLSNDVTIKYLAFKAHHFRRFSSAGAKIDEHLDQTKANSWYHRLETEEDKDDVAKYQQIINMWHGLGTNRLKNGPKTAFLRLKQAVSDELFIVPKVHETDYPSFRKLLELLTLAPKFFASYLWHILNSIRLSRDECHKYFQVSQMEYGMIYNTSEFFGKLWNVRPPGEKDNEEVTKLFHLSIATSLPQIVTLLLTKGADIKAVDGDGRTALHLASRNSDNPDILNILLKSGADVHSVNQNNGSTPLHVAAWNNTNPRVLQFLLDNGADVRAANKFGSTPIHLAAWNNQNPKIIELLLQNGASIRSINKYGSTPLHLAAWNNRNPLILKTLLDHGADCRALNKYGSTPLHVAALNNRNPEVIRMLWERATDLLKAANKYGSTPLHLAALNNHNPEVLRFLLDQGADLRSVNKYKRTPLHLAARHNSNPAILRFLLEMGADSNSIDRDGKKPVDHASLNGNNPNIIKVLLNPDSESDTEHHTRIKERVERPYYTMGRQRPSVVSHNCVSATLEKSQPPLVRRKTSRSLLN